MDQALFALFYFSFSFSFQAHALEADQYRIWKHLPLNDSINFLNEHINLELKKFLELKFNRFKKKETKDSYKYLNYRDDYMSQMDPLACQKVSKKFLRYIRPHFFKNRIKTPLLERGAGYVFPDELHLFKDIKKSIYHGPYWPFLMPVAQTLKINGVYLGSDKIDHFFSSGRRYYREYLRQIKKGKSHEEAKAIAIKYGLRLLEEKGLLGLAASGAFSYADLESNYQGMVLGIDLCEGKRPHLKLNSNGGWEVARKIDMRDHITPLWDEAYNNSYFAKYRLKGLKKALRAEYCDLGKTSQVRHLWAGYRRHIKPSFHTQTIQNLIKEGKMPDPSPQSIHAICNYKKGVLAEMPYW